MNKLMTQELTGGTIPTASTNYDFNGIHHEVASLQVTHASSTASFSIQPKVSLDGTNYKDFGTAVTVNNDSATTIYYDVGLRAFPYVRIAVTKTSGSLTALKLLVGFLAR